jgi:WhiB family redox-sensing transcriptional regulator
MSHMSHKCPHAKGTPPMTIEAEMLLRLFDRAEWMDHAACKGLTALFFPEPGENTDQARAICAECPVAVECLEYAETQNERFGVWGGRSPRARNITHGTWSGYNGGCRCPDCATVKRGQNVKRNRKAVA